MDQIFVTNNNDFLHTDRFNGQDFVFAPGEKVLLDVQAARLFFGFGNPDKTEALVRQGWAMPSAENPDPDRGAKILARFVFTRGVMIEEPVESSATLVVEEAAQA